MIIDSMNAFKNCTVGQVMRLNDNDNDYWPAGDNGLFH